MNPVFTIAKKEFTDGLRNRWVIAISVIFSLLAIGLAFFGSAASGTVGFVSLDSTMISLASLAVFIIPLIALMLCYDAFVGEQESGTLLLLLTYPLSKTQLLLGKFVGHGAIMAVANIIGFGFAALVVCLFSGDIAASDVIAKFSAFIGYAIMLSWVFISFAFVISALVDEKSKAAGLSLITWFMMVLVFDLALLTLLVTGDGLIDPDFLPYLLWLNPTDLFRLINLTALSQEDYSGLLSVASAANFSQATLLSIMALWIALPLSLASFIFNRKGL
ncbi:MAG: ABC transporter permease [Gammaproteobacteria bacterium]|nr:ABC transporter permease [Gammaproteobacteria bacterium]